MTVRVLLVTGSLGHGGTELAVVALARGLLARGRVTPHVAVLGEAGELGAELERDGVLVDELRIGGPLRSAAALRKLGMLADIVRQRRIRIVHTFLFDADVYGMLAARRGEPWAIVTTRRALKKGKWLHLLGYRLTNSLVDRIVANSTAVARFTMKKERVSPRKVVVIPNGVDLERFSSGDRFAFRAGLGVGEGETLVGAAGTIKKVKGQAVLLEAMARLFPRFPSLKLLLAGEPTPSYGEDVRRRARELGLSHRVLMPGVIPAAQVPDMLAGLDMFVLPSLSEGMSNALLEAMAAGLPIVATAVGGNPECLAQGECGLLVQPNDPGALEVAIEQHLNYPAQARESAARARQRAQDEYSLAGMLEKTERLYAELLERDWRALDLGKGPTTLGAGSAGKGRR
ncbi:MAG: glycosyltransferase [Acidobacteria bacterium]|nr:glycosyltransferase [Acidobacteriota bacterium]